MMKEKHGGFITMTEEMIGKEYEMTNSITPQSDGISLKDLQEAKNLMLETYAAWSG